MFIGNYLSKGLAYIFSIIILIQFSVSGLTENPFNIRRNVLVIIIDDLRHILDNTTIHLRNIQKFAAKGINFKNAYAQQALCAPSRNSLLTGRRPDSLHLYDFYNYWRHFVGNFTTLPQFFKENGYKTYSVGKVFHNGKSSNYTDDYPYSWSYYPFHASTEKYKDAAVCPDSYTKTFQKNLICPVDVHKQPGKTLPDLENIDIAIKILNKERKKDMPFFLAVGIHKPHIPLKFPKKYLDLVPIETVNPPKYSHKPELMPLVAWHPWTDVRHRDDIDRLNISFPMGIMPKKWTLKIRQSYYAAALYIDSLIGKLITNVDNNTIIVLTSDHGWSLGENGLWAKYSNFDVALRVPLIFYSHGIKPKSITCPVELVDIFPTLVDLAQIKTKIPKCKNDNDKSALCFEGKSLLPLMNHNPKCGYFAVSQYPRPCITPTTGSDKPHLRNIKIMGYSVRTERYRYTEWISFNHKKFTRNWNHVFGIELYDHKTDPEEANNLFINKKYIGIKMRLSKLLRLTVG